MGPRTYDRLDCSIGLPVRDSDVLEFARLPRGAGFDDTAERLENAYDVET